MKKLALGVTFALCASAAAADGYTDPIVEAPVIADAAAASSAPTPGMVLALTTLIIFGVGLSN